jgi:regulatory protein RepA
MPIDTHSTSPPTPSSPRFRKADIQRVLDDHLVIIDEIVAGLEAGEYGLVSSPGGVGKSYLMLLAAVQMSIGQPILNGLLGPARAGGQRVIYISSEDNPETRVTNRLIQIARELQIRRCDNRPDSHAALLLRNLSVVEASSFARDIEGGLEFEPDNPPRLIIVDTYRTFARGIDENSNDANSNFLSNLREHAKSYGAAFLIVHHTSKAALGSHSRGESTAGQERGASCIRDNSRAAITVWPPSPEEISNHDIRDPERIVVVRSSKSNHGPGGGEQWFRKNDMGVPVAMDRPSLAATPSSSNPSPNRRAGARIRPEEYTSIP